jgi:hypothetical protein
MQILDDRGYERLMAFTSGKDNFVHSLTKPKLSYRADRDYFMSTDSDPFKMIPNFMSNDNQEETNKMKAFQKYKQASPDMWEKRCPDLSGFTFLCKYTGEAIQSYRVFKDPSANYPVRLSQYAFLRKNGLISADEEFLDDFFAGVLKKKYLYEKTPLTYVNERLSQGSYELAYKHITLLKDKKILSEEKYKSLKGHIDTIRAKKY